MFLANSGGIDEISLIFFGSGKKVIVIVAILLAGFAYLLLYPMEYVKEFDNKDAFWEWHDSNIKRVFLVSYGFKNDGKVYCKYRKIKGEKK